MGEEEEVGCVPGCGVWAWGAGSCVRRGKGEALCGGGWEGWKRVEDGGKGWGLDGVEGERQFRLWKVMRAGGLWLWGRNGRWNDPR